MSRPLLCCAGILTVLALVMSFYGAAAAALVGLVAVVCYLVGCYLL